MKNTLQDLKKHLLTGVSYVIPFIASGGILIALAIAFAPMGPKGPIFDGSPILKLVVDIGGAAFSLLLPVLGGYIAFSRAGKPALVPGMVGGQIAGTVGAGFLGALLAGLIAGWLVELLKKLPMPKSLKPLMPILILPILSTVAIGVLMFEVLGVPIASLMVWLNDGLHGMSGGNAALLGAILGAMIAFDMGGPVNKVAFFFGAAMISQGNFQVMGAVAGAICVPPLGMGIATKLSKKLWTEAERETGSAAIAMGAIGITEGAIPFAASDPLRVIPAICAGSAVAGMIATVGGAGDHAPHGGLIVLPVVDNRLVYLTAIVVGVALTAAIITFLKRRSLRRTETTSMAPEAVGQ